MERVPERKLNELVQVRPEILRILVVDDDVRCLESIESCLELEGHNVWTARGGLEALDRARHLRKENKVLDLSILDFHMPDLTGIETFERLVEEFPRVRGIFISGDASRPIEEMVRQAGGQVLIPKPLDVFRVRRLIDEFYRDKGDA